MKNSFIYHVEWFETIKDLSPQRFYEIECAIVKYATTGEAPIFKDETLSYLFKLIAQHVDADRDKWNEISKKRSEAGRKGREQMVANQANASKCQQMPANQANVSDNVNVNVNGNVNENDNDIEDIEKKDINISQKKRFVKPTPEEVDAYCKERGNNIKGEDFCNYYEAKGWLVGKSPMKDWRAAVRTWERNRKSDNDDKGDKYDWGNDPDLPDREEWEAFLQFVNKHGGLTLTPYQYSDIKVQAGFNDLSKQQLADVIVECCKRGKNYLADNLQWKLSEVIRYIKNRNNG